MSGTSVQSISFNVISNLHGLISFKSNTIFNLFIDTIIMRKSFILLFLLLCILPCYSQVCKISQSGDSVEVFSAALQNDNTVKITVSNDSQESNANVTVEVEVTYLCSNTKRIARFSGKGLARASSTSEISLTISSPWPGEPCFVPIAVNAIGISGTKCL